jgi:hypothetical protein
MMEPRRERRTHSRPESEETRRVNAVFALRRIAQTLGTTSGHVLEGDIPVDEAEALIARLTPIVLVSA